MKLYVVNKAGKEVEIGPVMSSRPEMFETIGETFTLDGSDYLYHVHEVYAKPSPNTTIGASILFSLFFLLVTGQIFAAAGIFIIVFIVGKIYFHMDKKAVEHFNNSKTF